MKNAMLPAFKARVTRCTGTQPKTRNPGSQAHAENY